jgi:hypothetical protein
LPISASRLVVLSLAVSLLSRSAANAAPMVTLYDGSSSPTSQGWSRLNRGGTEATDTATGTTEFSTMTGPGFFNIYTYATRATDYIVSIRLAVLDSSFNPFDAAITFSPFGNAAALPTNDRNSSLTTGDGTVLWGDNAGGSVSGSTTAFHEYELRYQNGTLDFFRDATYADIINGTAVSLLSRTTGPTPAKNVGTIVFGDATNDANFNSRFVVDFVNLQDLAAAPTVREPGTLTLLVAGLVTLGARRRRRASEMMRETQ